MNELAVRCQYQVNRWNPEILRSCETCGREVKPLYMMAEANGYNTYYCCDSCLIARIMKLVKHVPLQPVGLSIVQNKNDL